MSSKADVVNLENSLPSWISDHLGEKSFKEDEVIQLPFSPKEDPPSPEGSPSVAISSPIEREINIMTQDEQDCLRETHSFPPSIQIRLPEEDETIASTCPGKVAFYEAAFHSTSSLG
ncbi:Platelet-derived growth factor receptor beta like [Actinidia chinensis var. chinensis]|uniref:Platelet-derived growth factor receptor beta like n=1 Tax=Actinidia chinensis var. chinensis TaxID=1590841 RepID=A0A2R6QHC0_ACTCC|nr:Platelet-derived growth factor receptor beta like [Actinidia chinensis var. chinensis]